MCGDRVHLCSIVSLLLRTRRSFRPVKVLAQKLEIVTVTVPRFGQGGRILLHLLLLLGLECRETIVKRVSKFDLDCLLNVEFCDLNGRLILVSRSILLPRCISHYSLDPLATPLHPSVSLHAHPRQLLMHGDDLLILLYERVELDLPMRILYLARPTRTLVGLLEAPEEVPRRRDEVL